MKWLLVWNNTTYLLQGELNFHGPATNYINFFQGRMKIENEDWGWGQWGWGWKLRIEDEDKNWTFDTGSTSCHHIQSQKGAVCKMFIDSIWQESKWRNYYPSRSDAHRGGSLKYFYFILLSNCSRYHYAREVWDCLLLSYYILMAAETLGMFLVLSDVI